MAGIGVMPGYVSAVNAYRAKKTAKAAPAIGTTPATKGALLGSMEGSLGLPGVPKVAAPKSIVPQVSIPRATVAAPGVSAPANTGLSEYGNELEGDPTWQLAQKNYADALSMGERSLFGDPFKQLLTQYGYVPSEAQIGGLSPDLQAMVRKYMTPDAVAAAQGNPYSTSATINKSFDQALAAAPIDYAERGLLSAPGKLSGGAAIAASNLGYQRGQQAASTMDEFLRGVGGANTNWLNYQNQQAASLRQAQEDVATRLSQERGYHDLLDQFGNVDQAALAQQAAQQDYSGGPNAIFQPDPQTGALMDRMQANGQYGSWASAMSNSINAANKPKPSAKTQKVLKKVKGK